MKKKKATKKAPEVEYESNSMDIEEFPEIEEILPDLAQQYRDLSVDIAALDLRRKAISEDIKTLLEVADHNSIRCGNLVCIKAKGGNVGRISPEKLIKAGVPISTIKKCTVYSKEYTYVQVRPVKPGASEE